MCNVFSAILYFTIIAVFTLAALKSDFPTSVYMFAGYFAGIISGFINGFIIAKITKEKGALCGLINGLIQAFLCVIVLFFANGGVFGKGMLILSGLIIAFSSVGGAVSVNMKIKKKY